MLQINRQVIAAVTGTFLEYYDYVLYVHFLIILSPLFFPNADPSINVLMGFASFAVGYVARPLGGILFGHIGDKVGRKKAIALALVFSTFATFAIGLLPTYSQIGILASVLLVFCRITQNFSVGGEVPGASCFLIETATKQNRCLRSSYINVSYMGAGIIATLIGFICTQPFMPSWAWRIPFLIAITFGSVGFYIRYKLEETPDFKRVIAKKEVLKIPLLEVIKKDRLQILCTLGISAGVLAPTAILYTYLPHIIKSNLNLSIAELLIMNCVIMTFSLISLLVLGKMGDRIGSRTVMFWSSVVFIGIAYPLFKVIHESVTFWPIFLAELIISLVCAGITAPLNVVTSLMYPTQRRYSGNAFAWGMGTIVFAGLCPLISKGLVSMTDNANSPALFLMLCGVASLFAVIYAPDISGEQDKPLHAFLKLRVFSRKRVS